MEHSTYAHPAERFDSPACAAHLPAPPPIDLAAYRIGRGTRLQAGYQRAVEAFLFQLQADGGVSENTVRHYAHDLEMFGRYLVKCRPRIETLQEVGPATLVGFLRYMTSVRNNSRESNRRRLAALRKLFEYVREREGLRHDPTEQLAIEAKRSERPVTLSLDECRRLLEATKMTSFPIRDHAIFRLFLTTGCTLSELTTLRLEDVTLGDGRITFSGRNDVRREVRLSPGCLEALRQYAAWRPKAPADSRAFFLNRRGESVTKGAVYHAFHIALRHAGIRKEGLTVHSLRHTCIALLWEAGVSIKVLQQFAGHRSLATTRTYRWVGPRPSVPQPWDWVHPVDASVDVPTEA